MGAGQSFGVPAQTPSRDSVRFLRKTANLEAGYDAIRGILACRVGRSHDRHER
jgi:hypothetical protein